MVVLRKIAIAACFLGVVGVIPGVSGDQVHPESLPDDRNTAVPVAPIPKHFIVSFSEMAEQTDQEGMNRVFESMSLLISEELGRRGYTQDDVDSFSKSEIDKILAEVFADAHTWTLQDLHDAAAPARQIAMQFIEDEAVEKYPYLVEQKQKYKAFNQLSENVSVTDVSRGFIDDPSGYQEGFLQLSLENNSEFTITHVEMDVIAFDGQPGRGVLFLKPEKPVEPGQSALLKASVDPSSRLGPSFVKADSADIGFKVNAYYTIDSGRVAEVEFTEDMADTLDLAKRIIHE